LSADTDDFSTRLRSFQFLVPHVADQDARFLLRTVSAAAATSSPAHRPHDKKARRLIRKTVVVHEPHEPDGNRASWIRRRMTLLPKRIGLRFGANAPRRWMSFCLLC
jgi:hypothetical protein